MAGVVRIWTDEENQLLTDYWGDKDIKFFVNKFNRSPRAIWKHATEKLKLGRPDENTSLMPVRTVVKQLGITWEKMRNWREDYNFPAKDIVLSMSRKRTMIDLELMWKWLKDHQFLWTSANMEEMALGVEPEWMKQKRAGDAPRKNHKKPWTKEDMKEAFRRYARGEDVSDIAAHFCRTEQSITTAIYDYKRFQNMM